MAGKARDSASAEHSYTLTERRANSFKLKALVNKHFISFDIKISDADEAFFML